MPVQMMQDTQRKYHPLQKKMNAEEEGLSVEQREALILSEYTVQDLMGEEPIPSLDIEMDEIQNELQRKMVEEIVCVGCGNFPYKPLQCKSCHKLFCKHCQLQLGKGTKPADFDKIENAKPSFGNLTKKMDYNMLSAGRDGRGNQPQGNLLINQPNQQQCCPNCQAQGDFMQEINKVLRNCIDFCEFPHRCPGPNGKGEIMWKTLGELQAHAQYHCPKFGCDICNMPQYQYMTRAQLYDHIKQDCPSVKILCQVCNREYERDEFHRHQCIKDFYVDSLKNMNMELVYQLADKLILHKRQKEGLGLCAKYQCVEKHRNSGKSYNMSMIVQNTEAAACKCFKCKQVIAGFEDSYSCIYCGETYCPPCLGYIKYYDLEEMEQLLATKHYNWGE